MFTYPNVPRCHHIKVNGTRCGSPALRDHKLCFFHQRWREQRIPMGMSQKHSLELPVLEDANSIQMTITQVMRLVLSQAITLKEAGILFYGLQIAAANLRHTTFEIGNEKHVVIDPATLAQAGIGVDSWKPADFPNPLQPAPEADSETKFTPDPAQSVYDNDSKTTEPQPEFFPELKAEVEDPPLMWRGRPRPRARKAPPRFARVGARTTNQHPSISESPEASPGLREPAGSQQPTASSFYQQKSPLLP